MAAPSVVPTVLLTPRSRPSPAEFEARFFQGLSDASRVRILEILADGERNVSELVEQTGLAQNRVSMHLSCLRNCGFITARRHGRFVFYQLSDRRVRELLRLARQVIAENAAQILACNVIVQETAGGYVKNEEIGS